MNYVVKEFETEERHVVYVYCDGRLVRCYATTIMGTEVTFRPVWRGC